MVAKPAGWPSTGHTLSDPESVRFQVEAALGHKVWAVHQLDKPTSGVFLMVRKKRLVPVWQKNLTSGQKIYWAICQGIVPWKQEHVQNHIGYLPDKKKVVVGPHGKASETRFRRLDITRDPESQDAKNIRCLVEARPKTGRTHQIRVHLKGFDHPIIGDHLYGDIELAPRAMLHCARIRSGGHTFEARPPLDFVEACAAGGLTLPSLWNAS